ncbi:MBL fold metallo-hydrolase [Halobacteriales archaeon SW_8_65_20]|nr:MAG: MBL fold metallo-hydrolase [Halobacteriales archaeon SW_6_65_46]PSQ52464.1 MAG: MBL fold metallo-hydrolase [Halobacteriales archaeon SW_8_65_20]
MKITCELHGTVRDAFGTDAATAELREGATVADLLTALDGGEERLDPLVRTADGEIRSHIAVHVDGEPVAACDGADTGLDDGDKVTILPSVAGGSATLPFEMEIVRLGNAAFEGHNNCYVLGLEPDAELTLVDTGFPTDETRADLEEGLTDLGVEFADVERILLTHWHGDHAGLAAAIQETSGCTVHAHETDTPLIDGSEATQDTDDPAFLDTLDSWGMPSAKQTELTEFLDAAAAEYASPTVETFADGARFDLGSVELEAVHLAGHTAGLCGFAFDGHDGRELFAGDALLPYYTPNVGGADVRVTDPLDAYLDTLTRIVDGGYERAWPGHRGAIVDPTGRAADIIDHHRERTRRVVGVLADGPATPWEVSAALFGSLRAIHILHGPGEAFAHLNHLTAAGLATQTDAGYELTTPEPETDALFPDVRDRLRSGYEPVH